ncbi:hypothetical protein WA026_001483 [Henosepilachna vigintioctopunctata]|uniref:Uncharacterized protein n=1 Tax=Henosepilachna vigintioctopunctata TaxID=420089 RepID=A0AAW1UIF4_9CUCU
MQCDNLNKVSTRNASNLNELDSALKELGMLATTTNSRDEYMKEISNNPSSSSFKINTKFVHNVSIGSYKKVVKSFIRYKPYIPRVRSRTKSENKDNENMDYIQNMLDSCIESIDTTHLKKAKSLESIVSENNQNINFRSFKFENMPELEIVSDSIQNLKVVE